MSRSTHKMWGAFALGVVVTLAGQTAFANTQTYTGGNCASPGGCAGNDFGSLTVPVNITFSDNPLSTGTTTDDWYFMVPAATVSGTITGDQISLSNFSVQGTVDSFQLWTTNGLGGSLKNEIASGTITSPFSQLILDPSVSNGDYALVVQSTLNPGSVGNYTGTLIAASPVPLPPAMWLLMSALACAAGAVLRLRPHTPAILASALPA